MERLQELSTRYSPENIWNMNESGCFFKALPDKGLVERGKQAKGGKKSKLRFKIAFLLMLPGKKSNSQLLHGRVECHVVLED